MKKLSVDLFLLVGAGLCAYGILKHVRQNGFKAIDVNASQAAANTARSDVITHPVRRLTSRKKDWQWAERN